MVEPHPRLRAGAPVRAGSPGCSWADSLFDDANAWAPTTPSSLPDEGYGWWEDNGF